MPTDLTGLIERVEKATGPDRELDVAIACALLDMRAHKVWGAWVGMRPKHAPEPTKEEFWRRYARHYTASLDADLALLKETLPGWTRAVDATAPECGIDVELFAPDDEIEKPHRVKGTHDLETHATLLALLRALQSQSTVSNNNETADNE
jgi:hypothetical protein